jgi:V/A-type H+-transporting ATPase subunit K
VVRLIIAALAGLIPLIPAAVYAFHRRRSAPGPTTRKLVSALAGFDLILALMIVGAGVVWLVSPQAVQAAPLGQETVANPYAPLAAAFAVAAGSLGAAYAVGTTGSAAVGAVAERPEIFGQAIVFVGLAEGVAIYGLIVAFIIVGG